MEESSNSIVESRQELMLSPTIHDNPTLRTSHFLQPSIHSNFEAISSLLSPSLPPTFDPPNWPLTVNFNGWRNPSEKWKEWVDKMASLHAPTWKKAGIYEAIFNSTYRFNKNDELLLGVAERWCPDTKSFIFPWGEATITLEDMMIAGYSVFGSPVFEPIESGESKAIEEALIRERRELNKLPVKKPLHSTWLKVFMDSGSEIEHEAFLSIWLSRFVLPTSFDVICECVFPIAIHLARGTRLALAPAVLATIYRDLSLLKEKIVALTTFGADSENREKAVVTTWAPFQLVLVWVWERFVKLSPEPNLIKNGEPRFAQWHNLKGRFQNVRLILDSSKEESFNWRPYTKIVENWDMPKFYREREMWVCPDSGVDEEILSFIRCLRVSELVGLGLECIEQYFPHRVARQFGFDQDLTGFVARCNASREDAWDCYIRPVTGLECYIPSRLFEGGVTTRYLEWWKRSVSVQQQETNSEITPKVSKEKGKGQEILSSCHISPKSSKRKRAVSELMGVEVSVKSSERMKNGRTSKSPTRKKEAGKLTGLQVSSKSSERKKRCETSKSPTRKKAAGELNGLQVSAKSSKIMKKGETSKSPTRKKAAGELNGLKVSARSPKRIKEGEAISSTKIALKTAKERVEADAECINPCLPSQISESLQQIVKGKVRGEAPVAHVNRSKKSRILAESSCTKNKESHKPATNLDDINNLSVPPGFPSKNDTVKAGDATADVSMTIAEMMKFEKNRSATGIKQCANGKNLAGFLGSHFCPVADNEFAKASAVAISGVRAGESESGDSNIAPAENEPLKDCHEERSEASESEQTHSNGNVSDISHQSHLSANERSLNFSDAVASKEKVSKAGGRQDVTGNKAAAQFDGFQIHAESKPQKVLEQALLVETVMLSEATEHVENVDHGDSISSANNKTREVVKPATSMEKVKLGEAAEEGQSTDIEDAPRQLDESESHSSSVAGNETPKNPELPDKVILIETGSLTQNNCSVGNVAHNGNTGSNSYSIDGPKLVILEERIERLGKIMAERKAALFRNICG